MREGDEQRILVKVPGNNPVSMGGDCSDGRRARDCNLDISKPFGTSVVGREGMEAGEDTVEADKLPGQQLVPLAVRELWASGAVEDETFGKLEVSRVVLNKPLSLLHGNW